MLPEFGNNLSAARESTARIWRERDDRVTGRCLVVAVVMDVVDLQRPLPLALWLIRQVFTLRTIVQAVLIVLFGRTTLRAPARTCVSAMLEHRMRRGLDGGKERKERRLPVDPQSHMVDAKVWALSCTRAEAQEREEGGAYQPLGEPSKCCAERETEGKYHFSACASTRLELLHRNADSASGTVGSCKHFKHYFPPGAPA